jgi:hypothetical protein
MKTSSTRASQSSDTSTVRRSSIQARGSSQRQPSRQNEETEQRRSAEGGERQSLPLQRAEASDGQAEQEIRETVAHEEIARRAYELWEQDGCPGGCSERHWLEAERQLRGSSFGGAPSEKDAREEARAIKASAERRAGAPARN